MRGENRLETTRRHRDRFGEWGHVFEIPKHCHGCRAALHRSRGYIDNITSSQEEYRQSQGHSQSRRGLVERNPRGTEFDEDGPPL
jgi:hypothetical protein